MNPAPILWDEKLPVSWSKPERFLFNTLAQLRKTGLKRPDSAEVETLKKRARSKYAQGPIISNLCSLDSKLNKSYWNTFYCCQTFEQEGVILKGRYCSNRWCLICNRIKTARMIHGYYEPLRLLSNKQFVTLTVPNVPAVRLSGAIGLMQMEFKRIQETARKSKQPLKGLKKLECTYNVKRDDFHPHFHAIIENSGPAEYLLKNWLDRFPGASDLAQKIKPADDNTCKELFKYFTKLVSKGKRSINPAALDTIFKSIKGRRIFQPIGGFRKNKEVTENFEKTRSEMYAFLADRTGDYWDYIPDAYDWMNISTGELLTGYTPSESMKQFIKIIEP